MTKINEKGSGNAIYGLGVIGAAVYFISATTSFTSGVLGFLKAIFWPAFSSTKFLNIWRFSFL